MAGSAQDTPQAATRGEGRITDEGIADLRKRIGVHQGNLSRKAVVTQEWIDRFAVGIGDPNPLWTDPVYGARTRYKSTIAVPTILFGIGGADVGTGLPGVHNMYTGAEMEWFRPIRPGEALTAYGYLKTVEEKQTKFAGRSVLLCTETIFEDPAKATVAKLRHFGLRVERSGAREGRMLLDQPLPTFTQAENDEIERRVLRQIVRGDLQRRGSDVTVGEELPEVVKSQFTGTDAVGWVRAGFGGALEGPFMFVQEFATIWRRRHPDAVVEHPRGFFESPEAVHWNDELARHVGVPAAYDMGNQRMSWMMQAVTNWIGDDGFLMRAASRLLRFVVVGDVTYCTARVTGKRKVDDGFEVDFEMTAANQRDEKIATGTATALLPD